MCMRVYAREKDRERESNKRSRNTGGSRHFEDARSALLLPRAPERERERERDSLPGDRGSIYVRVGVGYWYSIGGRYCAASG